MDAAPAGYGGADEQWPLVLPAPALSSAAGGAAPVSRYPASPAMTGVRVLGSPADWRRAGTAGIAGIAGIAAVPSAPRTARPGGGGNATAQ